MQHAKLSLHVLSAGICIIPKFSLKNKKYKHKKY